MIQSQSHVLTEQSCRFPAGREKILDQTSILEGKTSDSAGSTATDLERSVICCQSIVRLRLSGFEGAFFDVGELKRVIVEPRSLINFLALGLNDIVRPFVYDSDCEVFTQVFVGV